MSSDSPKLSVEQIRARFDNEVERFSNLETGQTAVMDAPLMLDLVAQAVQVLHPVGNSILDLGCGAGNYALKLLTVLPNSNVALVDLSGNMLERAQARVSPQTTGQVTIQQADLRDVVLGEGQFDVVTAGATLHHLRSRDQWEQVFRKIYAALRPGGSFWIIDLIEQTSPALQTLMWNRWGEYLTGLKDAAYRETVYAYVRAEDTPETLEYQLDLLRTVGFTRVEVLHKIACFAAFGGVKA